MTLHDLDEFCLDERRQLGAREAGPRARVGGGVADAVEAEQRIVVEEHVFRLVAHDVRHGLCLGRCGHDDANVSRVAVAEIQRVGAVDACE